MNNHKWLPFGKNILINPRSKNKIIGDTSKFYLYGEVLAVGEEVKSIKVGDTIAYTLWGINEIVDNESGTEEKSYLIKEDDDFILGVMKR